MSFPQAVPAALSGMGSSHLALVAVVAGTALLGTAATGIGEVGQDLQAAAPASAPVVRTVDQPVQLHSRSCPGEHHHRGGRLRADEL